jgi:isochorismate hydrolase
MMAGIPLIETYEMPVAGELPVNVAGWQADPARAVLLVHDMQRYFLRPFGDAAPVKTLVHNAARLRKAAAELGMPVAYTAQPGGMTVAERGLLKDFWGPGMTPSPEDRALVPEVASAEGDWVFTKWRYSAFHKSDLLERMRAAGRDQLIVCGVYAHVGVLMSLCDAFTNDIETFLAADAVADFNAEYHRTALTYAAERCAVVTTTDVLLGSLVAEEVLV